MKKFVSLIALSFIFLITAGFSPPGILTTQQDDPLYNIFYNERRITTTDYMVTDNLSLADIFENSGIQATGKNLFDGSSYVEDALSGDYSFSDGNLTVIETTYSDGLSPILFLKTNTTYNFNISSNSSSYFRLILFDESLNVVEDSRTDGLSFTFTTTDGNYYYFKIFAGTTSTAVDGGTLYDIQVEQGSTATVYEPYHSLQMLLDDDIDYYDNMFVHWSGFDIFESEPSQAQLDDWLYVYSEIEEYGTYYYYTFDGSTISVVWVAILFSGTYFYVKHAERDTKGAVVYAAIFFIIGLVLLRVIQLLIATTI